MRPEGNPLGGRPKAIIRGMERLHGQSRPVNARRYRSPDYASLIRATNHKFKVNAASTDRVGMEYQPGVLPEGMEFDLRPLLLGDINLDGIAGEECRRTDGIVRNTV